MTVAKRRKRTRRTERPKWSQEHNRFCRGVATHGNAARAFREAWPARAARMTDKSVIESASQLMAKINVASRVEAIRERGAALEGVTFAGHLRTLGELRDRASKKGQYSAAIRAEELRGKVAGMHGDEARLRKPGAEAPAEVPPIDVPPDAEVARALLALRQAERKAAKAQEIPS